MKKNIFVPADVSPAKVDEFIKNYTLITHGTDRLMLFACDQKIEHMNCDFYGPEIDPADNDPEHIFRIASQARIGAFATQLGLIARYGTSYKNVNYIVKLNSKTNLIPTEQKDPISKQLWNVQQVVDFKRNSGLPICGVGYTLYLGSEFETEMLTQAAQIIYEAHQQGLVTILWMYPRGQSIKNERDGLLISGAAGVANALGSDFVKINPPEGDSKMSSMQWLQIATQAAGNTKVICSGGSKKEPKEFIKELYLQLHEGKTSGNATGRNLHQRSLPEAIKFAEVISGIVLDNKKVE